jgi:hypothetical protein
MYIFPHDEASVRGADKKRRNSSLGTTLIYSSIHCLSQCDCFSELRSVLLCICLLISITFSLTLDSPSASPSTAPHTMLSHATPKKRKVDHTGANDDDDRHVPLGINLAVCYGTWSCEDGKFDS